mmetsp:Transcript_37691/g.90075  ORF Transcript_37691/g.90075 Transcript_37691/m.90075 type:complete len:211 (+) Transcript_37691:2893-3525(+)
MNGVVILDRGFLELALDTVSASLGGSSSDPRPLPPSDPLDFVLAVLASAVCGSDLLAEGRSGDPVLLPRGLVGKSLNRTDFSSDGSDGTQLVCWRSRTDLRGSFLFTVTSSSDAAPWSNSTRLISAAGRKLTVLASSTASPAASCDVTVVMESMNCTDASATDVVPASAHGVGTRSRKGRKLNGDSAMDGGSRESLAEGFWLDAWEGAAL